MKKVNIKKIFVLLFCVFVGGILISSPCSGASRYNSKYEKCISESGGRGDIEAVKQACRWASGVEDANTKNGCSIWIGDPSNSASTTIHVNQSSGTMPVAYYGMCTDYPDKTLSVQVSGACGAFGTAPLLVRGGWGQPSSVGSSLNVDKLKSCMGKCGKKTFSVQIQRVNGESGHSGSTTQSVTIDLGGEECGDIVTDKCEGWAPMPSYNASGKYHGTTSIDIKIKNHTMSGRAPGNWQPVFGDRDIWAMPTDVIHWKACYYPGVQRTSNTDVGSLDGEDLGYTEEYGVGGIYLPTDTCIKNSPLGVKYEKLYVKYERRYGTWENKFRMYGSGGSYNGSWPRGDDKIRYHIVEKQTHEGDAGKTFDNAAETGKPIEAKINTHKPETDFDDCDCEECTTPGWNPYAGGCIDEDEETGECNEYEGDWDYSDEYCEGWDAFSCSCCTSSDFATVAHTGIDGRAPCYGALCETGTTNTYAKALNDATVKLGPAKDGPLSVRLPYNFAVSTAVSIDRATVYSGSENAIKVKNVSTTVGTRYNSVTVADYATQVPNATINLYAYVSASNGGLDNFSGTGNICATLGGAAKQCLQLKTTNRTLNSGGSLSAHVDVIWQNIPYNAFDAAAGDYMCFASSVSPYTVVGDTDMIGAGNGIWAYSTPACAIIAKRPTFQVWGGSMYSVGTINVSHNSKVNIYKSYKSDVPSLWKQIGGTNTHFTSWVEESLILKDGTTNKVASGAATALNSSSPAKVGSSGGFCSNQTALSFANYSVSSTIICGSLNSTSVGASGISNAFIKNDNKREELINYWIKGNPSGSCSNQWGGTCKKIQSASGRDIKYITGENLTISATTITKGETYLVKSDGKVTITGNIKYTDNTYNLIEQIPKVIIYAKNVDINCGVTEVDAIIITKTGGTVKTCSEHNMATDSCDVSKGAEPCKNPLYSNQLKIFGMVITDNIELGRTYGSAANKDGNQNKDGIPSDGVAAEIFDFDTSILMWSEFMAGSEESDTQQIVYQQELAPRY